jgi:protein-S-isoprenylcysteine O-methyltransferase Ste14
MSELLQGFFTPWAIYLGLLLLHLFLPARQVIGYARNEQTGEALRYRLNGLPILIIAVAIWFGLGQGGFMPGEWLWIHRWSGLAGAATLGLLASIAVVLTAPSTGKTLMADLFLGRRFNPRAFGGRVDAKMLLYLLGATLLELNLLSFAAHHRIAFPNDSSPAVTLHVCLFSWFVCDYLIFERIHLYTYDLFAERLGFKLVWGCLAFYPYFYVVGLWSTADLPNPHAPAWQLVLSAVIFFMGWSLARGANMQKFLFKIDPSRAFLGVIEPETLSDGRKTLLCNGFWGVSRHVNYLGEVLMASGLALSLGWPLLLGPWLYPLYYVLLLGTRERDDDRLCSEKYGELWDQYRSRVRWRIVPGLY